MLLTVKFTNKEPHVEPTNRRFENVATPSASVNATAPRNSPNTYSLTFLFMAAAAAPV